MNKLSSLRDHLLQFPGRPGIEPGHLLTFAEKGQVHARAHGHNRHFELSYTATVVVANFSGQPDQLFFWALQWLATAQPDHDPDAVRWDADVLDGQHSDVSLSLDLRETVYVQETDDGIVLERAPETGLVPEYLDAEEWTLYANDQEVASWVAGEDIDDG